MALNFNPSSVFDVFPFLKSVPQAEWTAAQPRVLTYPSQARIFQKEDAANYGMFLLRGTVRITLIEENGSESLLTLLSAGEVCSLLVLCGLSDRDYPGSLIAETEVEVLFVSKSSFLSWIQVQPTIRNAIFGGLLDGMIRTSRMLQAKHNEPLEARLAKALLRTTTDTNPLLHITHQVLANEIGSAREVVSRVLKRYQEKGWVETGRGWVRVTNRGMLEAQLGDLVTEA
ncbi:Crp/Fnr family transcriptional regulator [Paenibacillus sp. UNC451MF]|uniref:Crp/Fnr family transcriptional regulator n=1 Tax=Paenibacillus sp. UNC451MF TaxID=1449063 RepID=UPI00068C9047|nr:Crp/Fnr family transcriptional regulator [Paenibacillus sp. UNC451MF]